MPVNNNLFVKKVEKKKEHKKEQLIRFYFKEAAGKQPPYKYNLYRLVLDKIFFPEFLCNKYFH